ncbi:uncharacterized protein F4807DRAFT_417270 [Annulohypoxylon truncatum]|uniref:uncharacterized protein n=1 Tax=Annulohypoxylon truncatum TaxID=327061 RepID=UPI0020072106|nr:uncharacterized protein F4807DRAFT_417270 [Annulohypoxylon truncatum]KAI1212014.1 hypothetical protein F4807DRAFT_417270 [Annulohypoxylon truncatum]
MSTAKRLPYRHPGVYIPYTNAGIGPHDWWTSDPRITENGFIYVDSLGRDRVLLVQSVSTGELFVNKIIRATEFQTVLPAELRISTTPEADCPLPTPHIVEGKLRRQFDECVAWQWFNDGTYSMYFRYCNGGTMGGLIEKYHAHLRPVPESFIWLAIERFCEIIRYFHGGLIPRQYGVAPHALWDRISHRDFAPNNVFIHYEPTRGGRVPNAGLEMNAFPNIIIGDFGEAALRTDNPFFMPNGVFGLPTFQLWEDVYLMGECLRSLAQTHIPDIPALIDPINENPMATVNGHMPAGDIPYSNDLINTLSEFEFPGGALGADIFGNHINAAGVVTPNYRVMPRFNRINNVILPLAQRRVRRYRGILRPRPAGYYRDIDVSWTRPPRVMPYEYLGVPAPPPPLAKAKKGKAAHKCPTPEREQKRRKLRHVTAWHHIRPKYQVKSLQYYPIKMTDINDVPPPAPYPPSPPGGDSTSPGE